MKRHLQLIIIILTLGSFLFSNIVLLGYSYKYIKNLSVVNEQKRLEYNKNNISGNIKNILENESRPMGVDGSKSIIVNNIFYFNEERNLINSNKRNIEYEKEVIDAAKKYNLKDKKYYRFGEISMFFVKHKEKLIIGIIDVENYLKKLDTGSFLVNIFDNEYNIIGSSEDSIGKLPAIDKYTKRMLNGYNETVESGGKVISYSNIEFSGENLYIMLTSKGNLGNISMRYTKRGMVLIMIITVFSFILIWKLIRKVNEYIDYERVSNNFEEYEIEQFIKDLSRNEENIKKYLESVVDLQNLHHDIRRVRERFER